MVFKAGKWSSMIIVLCSLYVYLVIIKYCVLVLLHLCMLCRNVFLILSELFHLATLKFHCISYIEEGQTVEENFKRKSVVVTTTVKNYSVHLNRSLFPFSRRQKPEDTLWLVMCH